MPDALPRYHVDHHIGNTGSVVGNPFQAFGDLHNIQRRMNFPGVFQHKGEKLSENLFVQLVDYIILYADLLRQLNIFMNQGIQALFDHGPGDVRHPGKIDVGLDLRHLVENNCFFSNIGRHIPNAFQVAVDFDGRRNEAKIASSRLSQR